MTDIVKASPRAVDLPESSDPMTWNATHRSLMEFAGLAQTVMRDGEASYTIHDPGVVAAFIRVCKVTGLDPFAKQIYAVKLGGKLTIVVGVDGFRVIAQRSKGYRGQIGPQWTADGEKWVDAWLPELQGGKKGDKPAAARIGIVRDGFAEPLWQVVTWAEFGKTSGNWDSTPAHMLGIRAETHGLRRAFPNDLSGLYTPEDIDESIVEGNAAGEIEMLGQIARQDDTEVLRVMWRDLRDSGRMNDTLHTAILARVGMLEAAATEAATPDAEPGQADDNAGPAGVREQDDSQARRSPHSAAAEEPPAEEPERELDPSLIGTPDDPNYVP